jgi:hypothetical protein
VGPGEPPSSGGVSDRGFIAYGTWPNRFIDWFKDLGFLDRPGVETQAAKDIAANLNRVKKSAVWNPPAATHGAAPGAAAPPPRNP